MPLENNPKKIPQLTAIPTPTAWQELDIETVVAKESTYANYKMTLSQVFTLATVSGSIKTALDALSALIATNTSNISTLSTTKLNVVGGTRTGLTANRAIITDATGVETYITGSTTQVIWFDGAWKPIAVTPSVDINWSTEKTSLGSSDMVLIYDAAWLSNKKHLAQASTTNEWMVEMATDAEALAWTDQTRYVNPMQLAKYNRFINTTWADYELQAGTPTRSEYGWQLDANWEAITTGFITTWPFTNLWPIDITFYCNTTFTSSFDIYFTGEVASWSGTASTSISTWAFTFPSATYTAGRFYKLTVTDGTVSNTIADWYIVKINIVRAWGTWTPNMNIYTVRYTLK